MSYSGSESGRNMERLVFYHNLYQPYYTSEITLSIPESVLKKTEYEYILGSYRDLNYSIYIIIDRCRENHEIGIFVDDEVEFDDPFHGALIDDVKVFEKIKNIDDKTLMKLFAENNCTHEWVINSRNIYKNMNNMSEMMTEMSYMEYSYTHLYESDSKLYQLINEFNVLNANFEKLIMEMNNPRKKTLISWYEKFHPSISKYIN